jgi:dTDP-4-dehydrorhamnose reductase
MHILLLGPDGQVGWELRRALAPLGRVTALGRRTAVADLCGDLAQPEALAATVRRLRPDVVVNAAAHTAVDQAEREPDLAHAVNAASPTAVARALAEWNGWLLHYKIGRAHV